MDDDIFTDAEIMVPTHGSFVVFIARGIGIIVAIAVIIVSILVVFFTYPSCLTNNNIFVCFSNSFLVGSFDAFFPENELVSFDT
jgi:hypothetical protein